jgi:hypothetical protein
MEISRRSRAFVGGQLRQRATARSQSAPCGREGLAGEEFVGGVVGRDQAGARAAFDGHVADGHPLFHREARMADPVYSNT